MRKIAFIWIYISHGHRRTKTEKTNNLPKWNDDWKRCRLCIYWALIYAWFGVFLLKSLTAGHASSFFRIYFSQNLAYVFILLGDLMDSCLQFRPHITSQVGVASISLLTKDTCYPSCGTRTVIQERLIIRVPWRSSELRTSMLYHKKKTFSKSLFSASFARSRLSFFLRKKSLLFGSRYIFQLWH